MPLFPFRSSSVKAKSSSSNGGSGGGGGLFSRNRGSRRDASARPLASISDPQRRRRSSPAAGDVVLSSAPPQSPPMTRESRSHDAVPRPPPTRRGRSPPRRRSTYRSSISPPSQRGSSRDDLHDRRRESPGRQRRRFSASDFPSSHLPSSPPTSTAPTLFPPLDLHSPDLRRGSASGASSPLIPHRIDYASPSAHPSNFQPRYPSSATHESQSRATQSPRLRPAVPHRTSQGSTKSSNPPSPRTVHSHRKKDSNDGFLKGLPGTFSTYTAVKELSKHADKAREWVEWFNNVQGAPDEIRVLSSKVKIAKDTVIQIQSSLEARPDLIEDESGQNLKMQIEEVIEGTTETLKKMSKLLSGFTAAAQHDGTALGHLEGFWQSFNYKNEGEGQIKATDAELQTQLSELTTLMSNIYARALRAPGPSPLKVSSQHIAAPAQSTSPNMPQEATANSRTPGVSSSRPSLEKFATIQQIRSPVDRMARFAFIPPQQKAMISTPDTPPVPPPNSTRGVEGIKRKETSLATKSNISRDPSQPLPYPPPPTKSHQTKLVKSPAPFNINTSGTPPPPYISVDPQKSPIDVLLDATWEGNIDAVAEALLNAPPNACDARNLTPLHLAAERDHMAIAMLLLDSGANVHARADGGCMPLHLAARYASADTVEMLIDRASADPNARTSDGRTPLHYATRSAEDGNEERREVIRTLRDLGADPTLATKKGETPRDVAQKRVYWDAAATLRRAEKKWLEEHTITPIVTSKEPAQRNWLQRHGFMKQ